MITVSETATAEGEELSGLIALEVADHGRELEPDEEECQPVDHEDHHLPGRRPEQPGVGSHDVRCAEAQHEAGRDGGQDAGDAQALGRQVGGERDEEADEHLDRRILEQREQP